jgi:hypothetical protein
MLASSHRSNPLSASPGGSRSSRGASRRRGSALAGVLVAFALAVLTSACAPREYLTPAGLNEIGGRDPKLEMIRVYPSAKFIVVYERSLGEGYDIGRAQGSLNREERARRIEVPIPRSLMGAVLEVERRDRIILWVTFDTRCAERSCAYGFAETEDALYRLFAVPAVEGYATPQLYRKSISRRHRMKPSKVFSRSRSLPVYFTERGFTASVALEIKRRDRLEVETIKVQSSGVPGEVLVEPVAPGGEP